MHTNFFSAFSCNYIFSIFSNSIQYFLLISVHSKIDTKHIAPSENLAEKKEISFTNQLPLANFQRIKSIYCFFFFSFSIIFIQHANIPYIRNMCLYQYANYIFSKLQYRLMSSLFIQALLILFLFEITGPLMIAYIYGLHYVTLYAGVCAHVKTKMMSHRYARQRAQFFFFILKNNRSTCST